MVVVREKFVIDSFKKLFEEFGREVGSIILPPVGVLCESISLFCKWEE